MPHPVYRFGDYRIDPSTRELARGGEIVAVSPPVFDCIAYLIEHRDRAVGRDELIAAVWGRVEIKDDLLAQTLVRARRAVGDSGGEQHAIRTIPRFGYRWIGAVEADDEAAHVVPPASPPAAATEAAPAERAPRPAPSQSARRRSVAIVALLAIVAAAALLAWMEWPRRAPGVATPPSTAAKAEAEEVFLVLPVRIADVDRESAWIHLGAMDYIATTLREQAHLRVLPSDATLTLVGAHAPSPADSAALQRLQAGAAAAYIVSPLATPTAKGWRIVLDIYHRGSRASYAAEGDNPLEAAARATAMFLGGLGLPPGAVAEQASPATESAQRIRAALFAGDLEQARRLIEQVPEAQRQAPEVRLMVGNVAVRSGRLDEAQTIYTALAADPDLSRTERAWAQIGLGVVAVRREDFAAVEREYGAAIQTLGEAADPYLLGLAYIGRGVANGGRGRTDAALADLGRARVEMERAGNRISMADIDVDLALVEANRGRDAAAIALYDRAIAALEDFGVRDHLAMALTDKSASQLALLDLADALATSRRAWETARPLENHAIVRHAAAALARTLLAGGQFTEAAAVLEQAETADDADDPELALLHARLDREHGRSADAARRVAAIVERLGAPGPAPDALELATLAIDVARDGGKPNLVRHFADRLRAAPPPANALRRDVALRLADAWLLDAGHDPGAGAAYADAFAAADAAGSPDLIVATGVAELRHLVAHGALEEATTVLGRLSQYAATDYAAACAAAMVYRARGESALATASEAQARALAGERDPSTAR